MLWLIDINVHYLCVQTTTLKGLVISIYGVTNISSQWINTWAFTDDVDEFFVRHFSVIVICVHLFQACVRRVTQTCNRIAPARLTHCLDRFRICLKSWRQSPTISDDGRHSRTAPTSTCWASPTKSLTTSKKVKPSHLVLILLMHSSNLPFTIRFR